jgi:hypothetical protein
MLNVVYAECLLCLMSLMLIITNNTKNPSMLSVLMLNVIILSVIMLSVNYA